MALPTPVLLESSSIPPELATLDGGFTSVVHSLSFVMTVIIVVLALGYQLVPGLAGMAVSTSGVKREESKKHFSKALFGIGVGLFLIPLLLYLYPNFGTLTFRMLTPSSTNQNENDGSGGITGGPITTPGTPSVGTKDISAMTSTEVAIRNRFSADGISINNGPCTEVGQTNCTSVGGMAENTITLLESIKSQCACSITITGGTEWWLHSATTKHVPGGGAVDLHEDGGALDNYIRNLPQASKSSNCNSNYSSNGFSFCDEVTSSAFTARHWHIQP